MVIRKPDDVKYSEVTPKKWYMSRRTFVAAASVAGAAALGGASLRQLFSPEEQAQAAAKIENVKKSAFSTPENETPYKDITNYNNYYEFSTDKYEPAGLAKDFKTRPWTVSLEGGARRKQVLDVDSIIKLAPAEERIYRLRCVEGWSMVIPWIGFPLSVLLSKMEPTAKAKFVEFTSVHDPKQMPGQRRDVLEWPYVEGLRMDEAMHPLTILAFGLYGEALPNQDGAPLRIVVPWKYGFKSAKAIVKIRMVEQQPVNTWNKAAPSEYGFYSNVNPEVDHPRWSQASERRIGEFRKRPTLKFNGYGEQVASLYAGMDLRKNF
jgi:sulfoxide reductase catalytic subunit YedY